LKVYNLEEIVPPKVNTRVPVGPVVRAIPAVALEVNALPAGTTPAAVPKVAVPETVLVIPEARQELMLHSLPLLKSIVYDSNCRNCRTVLR
jgi:hypothetical protein